MEHRLKAAAYNTSNREVDAEIDSANGSKKMARTAAGEEGQIDESIVNREADAESPFEEEEEEEGDLRRQSVRMRQRRLKESQAKNGVSGGEDSELEVDPPDDSSDNSSSADEAVDDAASADETGDSNAVAVRNNCIFCGQDEDHDPNPEFEENLVCAVCGDNAHRQCARDAESLSSDTGMLASLSTKRTFPNNHPQLIEHFSLPEPIDWRCLTCVENDLQPDELINDQDNTDQAERRRRRSSTSRFTRDLLPAHRGVSRPGSHSVFNTLILDDDPLDGSRSLRKRKATSEQPDGPEKRPRKLSALASEPGKSPERILAEKIEALNSNVDKSSTRSSIEPQHPRPSRTPKRRRSEDQATTLVSIIHRSSSALKLSFKIKPSKLKSIFQSKRKRERPRHSMSQAVPDRERPTSSSHYATPFYAFHERENDELKSKPYGGILSEDDAETTKTLPLQFDRGKFNKAREKAEEERKERAALSEAETDSKARSQKLAGPPSKIKCVYFGGHEIETWYAAPYPEEYSRNKVLYICEFCLKYMSSDFVAWRHKLKCPAKHPPGDEIYRDRSISIFEVDGRKNPVYCQNLCLLAKLFLGSKTLYYDVEPFLFYVMTEYDELGCHFVGYFSKEKRPSSLNNVSCILTLPTHQRKGYGNLLISFSYLLTRVEGKTGSPEKPLSDMGLVSYRNYWRLTLSYELSNQIGPISISDLSERTGMTADDIVAALEGLRALVRDPITKTYALRLDYEYFQKCIEEWEGKCYVTVNPDALVWTPYIMGRSNLAHYETAPPLPTVAPREDEEDEKQAQPEEGVQQATQNDSADPDVAVIDDDGSVPTINGENSDETQLAKQLNAGRAIEAANSAAKSVTKPPTSSPTKPNGNPGTPSLGYATIVPPTRFEIFPPIPGLQARIKSKRGGWRGSHRKSTVNSTPVITPSMLRRRGKPPLESPDTPKVPSGSSSASSNRRRTRQAGPIVDELDPNGATAQQDSNSVEGDGEDPDADSEHDAEDENDDEGMQDAEGESDDGMQGDGEYHSEEDADADADAEADADADSGAESDEAVVDD